MLVLNNLSQALALGSRFFGSFRHAKDKKEGDCHCRQGVLIVCCEVYLLGHADHPVGDAWQVEAKLVFSGLIQVF